MWGTQQNMCRDCKIMRKYGPMKPILILFALVALTGCAEFSVPGIGSTKERIVPVPAEDARILFEAPSFANRPPLRMKFTDEWQREEYALFQGAGSQAEIFYIAATARETSLEYEIGLKSRIKSWNYNAGSKIVWGTESEGFSAFGKIFYLPYLRGRDSCFGFSAEWAVAGDDPELNPTKAVFGYYCETSDVELTTERIESLIDTIEVSRFASGSASKAPASLGVTASVTGNPDFPFALARGYTSEGQSFVDRAY